MDFKVIVDICTVIGATGVIFAVLNFFYKKAKNMLEIIQYHSDKLKIDTVTLLSKAISTVKRNEIYPYLKLLIDQQNKFLIETKLTLNLIVIVTSGAVAFV